MSKFPEYVRKAKTVATSVVTIGAAVVAVLAVVSTVLVPVLPVAVGVKVGAWVLAASGAIKAVTEVVKRVTPVFDDLVGLEPVSTLDKAASFGNAAAVEEWGEDWQNQDFWGEAA